MICNNDKPNLKEINENIFKALNRCNEVNAVKTKGNKVKNSTINNFAVDVNAVQTRKNFCSLCTIKNGSRVVSHSTGACPVYSDPISKIKRLEALNSCTKCGYANHNSKYCRFKFLRKCSNCSGDHMLFLCNSKASPAGKRSERNFTSGGNNNNNNNRKATINTAAIQSVMQVHIGNESLLHTFTAHVKDNSIRVMKDSGCQPNFIRTSVADKLNLEVIENSFPVIVNGFNDSQQYLTKVVLMDMLVGNQIFSVKAICIPDIRTELDIPGLSKCAQNFVDKGYKLADINLIDGTDRIDNLDFILGTNSSEILLENQVLFGEGEVSVYS